MWEVRPLGSIVEIMGGGTPSRSRAEFWDGDIPWVSPKDMRSAQIDDTEEHISPLGLKESATQVVPAGSVLVVGRSGVLAHRVPIAINSRPVALNQDMKALRPKRGVSLLPAFVRYQLVALEREILGSCVKAGATVQSIDARAFASLPFRLPRLQEQERLVELLDEADRLRQLRATADARARRILPALFEETFVLHPDRARWPTVSVEQLAALHDGATRTGPFGSALRHSEFVPEGVPVLGIDNVVQNRFAWDERRYVTREKFRELERYRVSPGDVLVTIMGTVGRTAVVPDGIGDAVNTKHLAAITLDPQKTKPEYLAAALRLDPEVLHQVNAAGRGAIMTGLNLGIIRALRVPQAPLALQEDFSRRVVELRALDDLRTASRTKLDALFDELLRRAFSGELTARWREAHAAELADVAPPPSTEKTHPDAA